MAIQMRLPKENNEFFVDFNNAYWVVQYAGCRVSLDKKIGYKFLLVAYPDAYSKRCFFENKTPQALKVGNGQVMETQEAYIYAKELYTWECACEANEIFPEGIPSDVDEQLKICYEFAKRKLGLKEGEYINV